MFDGGASGLDPGGMSRGGSVVSRAHNVVHHSAPSHRDGARRAEGLAAPTSRRTAPARAREWAPRD